MDAEQMFNEMKAQPQGGNVNQPIGTLLGGQAQSSGGNPQMAGKVIEKAGEMTGSAATEKIGAGIAKFFAFYGGETVSQIKNNVKINIIGGPDSVNSKEDKTFYSNVHIPRKKV